MRINRLLLRTGIPLIDKQHTEYADLVDQCFKLASHGNVSTPALRKQVSAVTKYAMEHLDAEEFLMRSRKYPAYAEHSSKHGIFRDEMDPLISEIEEDMNLDEYTIRLSRWLIEWFCDHVQTDDLKLAVFLKGATDEGLPNKSDAGVMLGN
jgi:hemerythrin-like metal-binding protein